ncbi:hypothetical protein J6590_030344 [Homalodisca vitripennis]|nr:hypothetical protein J6590_030344 [Homalodisca vitripennis]
MRENRDEEVTFCFDLQQVQPLPKTPIQEAFYKRQLSFYCLCVVGSDARDPVFYTWTEELAGRGAIEKGKAVVEKTTGRHEVSTVKVKSTDHFRFQSDTEQFISLQKKGWSSTKCFSTPLEPVPLGHAIKASKKKDIEPLLLKLMYGDEWKNNANLSWYKIILEETPECHEIEGDEEECECDCLEPDVGLHS